MSAKLFASLGAKHLFRSTDWAKEECLKTLSAETVKLSASNTIFSQIGTHPNLFRFAKCRKYAKSQINKADDSGYSLCRLLHVCRLWAIVPARLQASIVATAKLNFCVRNGNRWTLCVWNTDCEAGFPLLFTMSKTRIKGNHRKLKLK